MPVRLGRGNGGAASSTVKETARLSPPTWARHSTGTGGEVDGQEMIVSLNTALAPREAERGLKGGAGDCSRHSESNCCRKRIPEPSPIGLAPVTATSPRA